MRERLAIARSRSRFETCCLEAFADETGVLLLRWLDNNDQEAGRRVHSAIARELTRRSRLSILQANSAVRKVFTFLHDQRCLVCKGRGQTRNDAGVYRACLACNATGMVGGAPLHWTPNHVSVLCESLASIGRALSSAREAAKDG